MTTTTVKADSLAPWQQQAMAVPEAYDLALAGGRGGGKTRLLAAIFLRHCEQHGDKARCLVVRRSFPGLMDLEAEFRAFFGEIYGPAVRYDQQKHRFTLPGGGVITLDQLEREADFMKFQGKSYTHVAVDESGQWATPELLDRLRSSLRGPEGVPVRFFLLANPGGAGHAWIAQRYALKQSWIPYTCHATGAEFVTIASTYRDNPFIDRDKYAQNLKAATATDPELAKAWLDGDWTVIRGAYFSAVIDQQRVMIEPWSAIPERTMGTRFQPYLAHDYGVAAPSVTYLMVESPGSKGPDGFFYPRGSIILLDEYASVDRDDLNRGLGLTVPELSARILDLTHQWNVRPDGVADDAIFNRTGSQAGTIADEFKQCGVRFRPAQKGSRLAGWEKMRRLLMAAGQPDQAGLYVSRNCHYWWQTVPTLPRDPRRVEDVDSSAPDHAADACRYGLNHRRPIAPCPRWG